jgi:hypothetical protein
MTPLVLAVLFMLPSWMVAETGDERPFNPGDHFLYDIKWGFLKVGEAELMVENPGEQEPGDLKFVILVRTTSWADTFYSVRNRIESYTDANVTQSLSYKKSQSEGDRKREVTVTFDWEKKTAQYKNFDDLYGPINIPEGCHDPFSVLFSFRLEDFVLGEHISVPVTDGKKSLTADIVVVEKERIKVKAGQFDCLRVVPDTKDLGGIFSKSDDASMNIWFSDDKNKLIVKMSSSVSVGSFKVELREYVLGDPK